MNHSLGHSARPPILDFILSQLAPAALRLISTVLLPVRLEDTKALAARRAAIILLNHTLPLLLTAVGAASEEDDDHAEEQANKRRQQAPDRDTEGRFAARTILVDVMAEDAKKAEVDRQGDQSQDPGQQRDHGTHERAHNAGAAGEQEGDECNAALDRVKYHHASEGI